MSFRGASFNNGVQKSTGIDFTFTRNNVTRDPYGTAKLANEPRYAKTRLQCGSIEAPTSHYTPGGNCSLFDAGYASDNATPLWLVYDAARARMSLFSGTFTLDGNYFDILLAATGSRTAGMVTGLNAAGITRDLFKNQQTMDNYANECWTPVAGIICHGLVAIVCQVAVKDSGDDGSSAAHWRLQHLGIACCKASSWISSPGTGFFANSAVSEQLYTSTAGQLGALWAARWDKLDRDGTPPVKVYLNGTDYEAHTSAIGGLAWILPAVRSTTTADDWTVDGVAEAMRQQFAGDLRHWHACVVKRHGTSGVKVIASTGDGPANQSNLCAVLADEGSATAHDTTYRDGLTTGADDARNWYSGTPDNWTVPTIPGSGGSGVIHGALTADGSPTSGADTADSYPGNQFVGVSQNAAGSFVCGSDETCDGVLEAYPGDDDTQLEYASLWSPQRVEVVPPTGAPAFVDTKWTLFVIDERDPLRNNSGFVVNLAPGTNYAVTTISSRMLWSRDGVNVQEIFPHGAAVIYNVRYLDGRIYYGVGNSIRSIAEPSASRTVRPLEVCPGGVNYGSTTPSVSITSVGGQTVATEIAYASAPSGLPALDSTKTVWKISHTGVSGANMFTALCGRAIPEGTKEVLVKFYLMNTPPASRDNDAVSQQLALSFGVAIAKESNGTSSTSTTTQSPYKSAEHGRWRLVTMRVNLESSELVAFTGDDYRLTLICQCQGGVPSPNDFYIAFDGVYATNATTGDDAAAYPITRGTTGADEVAVVSGFTLPVSGQDWTLIFDGFLSKEAHWGADLGCCYYHTTAVNVDSTHTTLTSAPATDIFTGGLLRLGTTTNCGLTGVRITGFNTGTLVATHEALTGISAGAGKTVIVLKPRYDTVNLIDRPRELFALLSADGQTGIVVYATTTKGLGGEDGHAFGFAPIVSGAVDWTQYVIDGSGNDWFTPGDALKLSLRADSNSGAFFLGVSLGGVTQTYQSDFGGFVSNWIGDEVLTKVRIGGATGVTPIQAVSLVADESAYLSDNDVDAALGAISNTPSNLSGSSHRIDRPDRLSRLAR